MDPAIRLLNDVRDAEGIEASIPELAYRLEIDATDELDTALKLQSVLDRLGLQSIPDLRRGEYHQPRALLPASAVSEPKVRTEIAQVENHRLELKSTFLYPIEQAAARPDTPVHKLNPEITQHDVLKTICGFMNADGGILYVGVTDDHQIFGLSKDFEFLRSPSAFDLWEQRLRSLLETRFLDGRQVQHHVSVGFYTIEERPIARCTVVRRADESFLKERDGFHFYMRAGNRTNDVAIQDLPAVVLSRRELL